MDLSLLLERCSNGDELAWEALVRRFQSRIYGMAYHYVGNAEDARDLAQEVFVRLYRNIKACSDPEAFLPWVVRITRNASIDFLRRRKARPAGRGVALEEIGDLQASGPDPEEESASRLRKQMIHRALQQLTALNREIILLKDIQGLKLEEISSMLRVPLGTIKSRSNRARIELARRVLALAGGGQDQEESR